jgi:hypothetical protein
VIKKTVREIETGEGVLIFDDTLQEKPHSMSQNWVGFLTHSKATGKLVSFE